jgi:hypothetical protein
MRWKLSAVLWWGGALVILAVIATSVMAADSSIPDTSASDEALASQYAGTRQVVSQLLVKDP